MTLLYCDSFDHYTAPLDKWNSSYGSAMSTNTGGRNGTLGLRSTNRGSGIYRNLGTSSTGVVLGFAWNGASGAITPANTSVISAIHASAGGMTGATVQLEIAISTGSRLLLLRGDAQSSPTVLATGTTPIIAGTWYYIELKAFIDPTVGWYELRINENTEFSATGVNTRNVASGTYDTIRMKGNTNNTINSEQTTYDDLYVCNLLGTTNNDFLGDVRVEALFPTGNGNSSQFVGSDGNSTDNYLLIDESAPSTADYVQSLTPGDEDTYVYGSVTPTSGTIYAVQVLPFAAKSDAGARSIVSVARLSGTEEDGAADSLSTTTAYFPDVRETKPGGGAWSISDVNAAEFGVKVSA